MSSHFYHVGILVRDLDEAIPRFSAMFECEFGQRLRYPTECFADPEPRAVTVEVSFSKGGGPYIELIQGHDDEGFFRMDLGERLHHIGRWQPDLAAKIARLESTGIEREASIEINGETVVYFNQPGTFHGARLELLDPASSEAMYAMWESAPTYGA